MQQLINILCSKNFLTNSSLNSAEKIKLIKEEILNHCSNVFTENNRLLIDNLDNKYGSGSVKLVVDFGGDHGWTLLARAVDLEDLDIVKWLIEEQGANIDKTNMFGLSPLAIASAKGNIKLVNYLLNHHANINQAILNSIDEYGDQIESTGRTALHAAVGNGKVDVCEILIENGASFEKDLRGETPLDLANHLHEIVNDLNNNIEHKDAVEYFGNRCVRFPEKIPPIKDLESIKELLSTITHTYTLK